MPGGEGIGADTDHVLWRVDRQQEAEADHVAEQHAHAQWVDVSAKLQQQGNHDRQHRRGQRRGAGETEVNDDQKATEHGEHPEWRQPIHAQVGYQQLGQPGAGARGQHRTTEADANAEDDHRAPGNARLCLLPAHYAEPWHQQRRQAHQGGGSGVEGVQLALGGPETEQGEDDGQQLALIEGHRPEFTERLAHGLLAAFDAIGFRRHDAQDHPVKHR